jgi:3-(3-hydroxy-phenyl)propionate hydroxylase
MSSERVIVAGAGPAGMVAATLLSQAGVPVLVLEAEADLPQDLRASTFHPPTLDMLDGIGAAQPLIEQGLVCPTWQFRDRAGGVVATFDHAMIAGDTQHPYRLQCEQWRLTRLLRDRMEANPDAAIRYGARVAAAAQDGNGVAVTLQDGEVLKGRFLIGTDGASSAVRKSLGVKFTGMTIPEIFLTVSTTFRFEDAMEDLAPIAYVSDPQEWLVLLRNRRLWRVLLPTDPTLTDDQITAPANVEQRLQAVFPTDQPYETVHTTAYRVHERVADRYVVGRVCLAGDAAHVNNPLGGMGMNGGIHDAFNLAGKLTQVWHGAPMDLLGRYERQRRKVALDVVQATALRNREMLNQRDPDKRRAHHDQLRATVADPEKHRAALLRSSMIQSLRDLEAVE